MATLIAIAHPDETVAKGDLAYPARSQTERRNELEAAASVSHVPRDGGGVTR
jgi:hypothetical protein